MHGRAVSTTHEIRDVWAVAVVSDFHKTSYMP